MTTSPAIRKALDPALANEAERSAAKARQQEVEEWSALLVGMLQPPPTPAPVPAPPSLPPEAWRQSVSRMTLTRPVTRGFAKEPPAPVNPSTEPGDSDDPGRLQLRFDSGKLGEVALMVERRSEGLRVVIGSTNPDAVNLFGTEREALHQALVASGLDVENIRIVRLESIGTVLARTRLSPEARRLREQQQAAKKKDSKRHRGPGLNVIG